MSKNTTNSLEVIKLIYRANIEYDNNGVGSLSTFCFCEQVNDTKIEDVKAFKKYLTTIFAGLLIFLIEPIILILMMSWISAWMVWIFLSVFHGSLLIGM